MVNYRIPRPYHEVWLVLNRKKVFPGGSAGKILFTMQVEDLGFTWSEDPTKQKQKLMAAWEEMRGRDIRMSGRMGTLCYIENG